MRNLRSLEKDLFPKGKTKYQTLSRQSRSNIEDEDKDDSVKKNSPHPEPQLSEEVVTSDDPIQNSVELPSDVEEA